MKNKIILILAIVVSLLLCSCSASNVGIDEKPSETPEVNPGAELDSEGYGGERKIVITVDYSIETKTFDETVAKLDSAVKACGGYTQTSSVNSSGEKYATLVLKIPAAKADEFAKAAEGTGNVTRQNRTGTDITLEYYDTEARLKSLKAEHDRVTALMNKAETIPETIEISARLTEIEKEYNSLQSRLNVLNNSVDYATFTINLYEVTSYSDVVVPVTFWEKIGNAAVNSFTFFGKACQSILIALIYLLPFLLVAGVITFIIIFAVKHKHKAKNK